MRGQLALQMTGAALPPAGRKAAYLQAPYNLMTRSIHLVDLAAGKDTIASSRADGVSSRT
jgi:hypothetical protein